MEMSASAKLANMTANQPQVDAKENFRVSLMSLFCFFAAVAVGFALQISNGFLNWRALLAIGFAIALCTVGLVLPRMTLLLPLRTTSAMRRGFLIFLAVYFVGGIAMLRIRHPPIDVLIMENDSVSALLHGSDPYGRNVTHQDIYSPDQRIYPAGSEANGRVRVGFPYPPLTILWTIPGFLLGDVRYSFLGAVVLTALMMFYGEPNLNGVFAAVLMLFVPATLFVLAFGWTEPLMVMMLAATLLAATKSQRWMPVALGLFFASKQYSFLAAPLAVLLLPKFSWKAYLWLLAKAGAVAAAVTLPFLLWDPQGFWWSLFGFRLGVPLRLDALSVSALLATHGYREIPQWGVALVVITSIVFALTKAPRTPAAFAASLGLVSLVFFVFNIAAFCNYYFFCGGALCLAASGSAYDSGETLLAVVKLSPRALDALQPYGPD
jgi:hypothetical protein